MKSYDGKDIIVGMKVMVLVTPVRQIHMFETGVVVALTTKQVHISTTRVRKWVSNQSEIVTHIVKRYPDQIIVGGL